MISWWVSIEFVLIGLKNCDFLRNLEHEQLIFPMIPLHKNSDFHFDNLSLSKFLSLILQETLGRVIQK